MIDTKALRELAQKATPGPWKIVSDALHFHSLTSIFAGKVDHKNRIPAQMIVDIGGNDESPQLEANTRFIAAANPAVVLAMLDEIDRLQKIESAAQNLAKVRGRHNSELAMNQLLEALE